MLPCVFCLVFRPQLTGWQIREVANIQFPSQNHESAQVVKSGLLERKTRIVKKYGEAFVVLTASGFMHTYDKDPTSVSRESDPKSIAQPTLSLYLPNSSLGPPAPASSSKHKFYIEAVKASAKKESKFKLGGKKGVLRFLLVLSHFC